VAPAGENVLRLLPPLNVTDEDIQEGLERIHRAMESLVSASSIATATKV